SCRFTHGWRRHPPTQSVAAPRQHLPDSTSYSLTAAYNEITASVPAWRHAHRAHGRTHTPWARFDVTDADHPEPDTFCRCAGQCQSGTVHITRQSESAAL